MAYCTHWAARCKDNGEKYSVFQLNFETHVYVIPLQLKKRKKKLVRDAE
jgi:hypothetical protein